jgi:hypothetical protein
MRNWLRNFMIGRYGPDQLYFFLFILAVICLVVSRICAAIPALYLAFLFVGYALLVFALFRMLSHNIYKRRQENDRFLRFWWPIRQWFVNQHLRFKCRKTHRFFRCPSCRNLLRVPRGKGKITITCPRCGERFSRKT